MKQLMITVKPEYLVDILNGNKTLELRTYMLFKGWVNVYCGKGKPYLYKLDDNGNYYITNVKVNNEIYILNSKVVCRFWFDEYDVIEYDSEQHKSILNKSCLTLDQVNNYSKGQDLYAWHIKRLEIFPEPKELGEFYKQLNYPNGEIITPNICDCHIEHVYKECMNSFKLTHAPQKYAYVWGKEE